MPAIQPPPPVVGRLTARPRESRWLLRRVEIIAPEGAYVVTWDGRGLGREGVLIDGREVATATSIWWWVPRFDFLLGPHDARVEVRVWPWFTVRSFELSVGGEVVYAEGRPISSRRGASSTS